MKKMILGYSMDRSIPEVTESDCKLLTHMSVAFGLIQDNRVQMSQFTNLHCLADWRKWNPEMKIILSIGGWGAGGFSEAAFTEAGRKEFAETACDAMQEFGFDGVDIDWEYPCYGEAGIGWHKDDKQNYTLFLKCLRETLDARFPGEHRLLTSAVGADQYFVDGTEMDKASQYLDYVLVMTYDMRGGFQVLTGHHTNLYTSTGDLFRISADSSIRMYMNAGVPREKIAIGAAFYARMWKEVTNVNNGLFQMAKTTGSFGAGFDEITNKLIVTEGYTRYWDDEAKAPYLFNGENFVTYDDEESLAHKCDYLVENGHAGIFYWAHPGDKERLMLKTLHNKLNA